MSVKHLGFFHYGGGRGLREISLVQAIKWPMGLYDFGDPPPIWREPH